MSGAEQALVAALYETLETHEALAGRLNGVFATPPGRATPPYALLGEMIVTDWSTKTEEGREIRFLVTLFEEPERADRLAELMAEAETAIEAMPRDPAGWRIASLVFQRGRVLREQPWRAVLEYRARMLSV